MINRAELQIAEYILRAERKLGELLTAAKAAGQIKEGNPKLRATVDDNDSCVRLKEIGISRDLSSRAQQIAAIAKAAGQITHIPRHKQQHVVDPDMLVRLDEIGISRDLSSRAHRIAAIAKAEFEQVILILRLLRCGTR